jgi:hypothetical protein
MTLDMKMSAVRKIEKKTAPKTDRRSLDDVLAANQKAFEESGMTEEELTELILREIKAYRREKREEARQKL